MLNILGIGTAVGQTAITDAEGRALASGASSLIAGETRRSVLSRDYLNDTGNSDIDAVKVSGNQSPTDLGVMAAQAAIAEAGISVEQIGLVIGDCSTPWQTTPSEGQRVADRLGLKVPAYDLGGGGIVPQQLASLSRWRADRVPEYTLLISVSTPTSRINFRAGGDERWHFGDGASACVVSSKHTGKLTVLDAESAFLGGAGRSLIIDQFNPVTADISALRSRIESSTSDAVGRVVFKHKAHGPQVVLAVGEADAEMAARIASGHSISRFASTFRDNGHLLTAGCFLAFEKLKETLKRGDRVIFAQTVPGFVAGFAVCEVN